MTLLSGSLIFYAVGEPKYLMLLMLSVLLNYFWGLHLQGGKRADNRKKNRRNRNRKIILAVALLSNVGVLGLFKYAAGSWGFPLGISFYTFQVLSYLLDVYWGKTKRERSFLKFATYITMFPKLISGPIVCYGDMAGALKERRFTAENIQDGLKVFTLGLSAKVLLADRIGMLWNQVQTTGFISISTPLAWLTAIAYSMKIYFDFYGYSLMAIGLGRMLGFHLPDNFRLPYMARSVRDFYRRWHMTLGNWFCSYVYIPLGGNRKGEFRTVCNLLAVWLLTSLWHGTTVNFLMWGGLLCFLIIMERQAEKLGFLSKLKVLPHFYLWAVIPVTWMCFAISDLSQLQVYLGRMFGWEQGINVNGMDWKNMLGDYWLLLLTCFFCCTPAVKKIYKKLKNRFAGMVVLGFLFWLCVWRIVEEGNNTFMYFRF